MKERTASHFFMRLLPLALLPAGFMVAGRRESALTADRERGVPQDSLRSLGEPEPAPEIAAVADEPEAEAAAPESGSKPEIAAVADEPPSEDPSARGTTVNLRKLVVETRRQIAEQLDASFERLAEPGDAPGTAPPEAAREESIYCVVLNEESPAPPEAPGESTEHSQSFESLDLNWDPAEEDLLSLYRRDYRASQPRPDQLSLELNPWWKREAAHAVFGAILAGLAILALLGAYFVL